MFADLALAVLAAWLAAAVVVIVWALLATRARPVNVWPDGDPYAADVAAFRREMHDWDRET